MLPLDEPLVEQLQRAGEARGWKLCVSRGEEQVVVAVTEGGDAAELAAGLPDRSQLDVVTVHGREHYAWRRRRRLFLNVLVASLGVLTAVGWFVPIWGFLRPPVRSLSTPSLVHVEGASGMPVNSGKRIRFRDKVVLLIQSEPGLFHALGGRCTFMDNCQLEWSSELRRIVCPCHGCQFDVHGNIEAGPPSIPLSSFAVERLGEQVYVRREQL